MTMRTVTISGPTMNRGQADQATKLLASKLGPNHRLYPYYCPQNPKLIPAAISQYLKHAFPDYAILISPIDMISVESVCKLQIIGKVLIQHEPRQNMIVVTFNEAATEYILQPFHTKLHTMVPQVPDARGAFMILEKNGEMSVHPHRLDPNDPHDVMKIRTSLKNIMEMGPQSCSVCLSTLEEMRQDDPTKVNVTFRHCDICTAVLCKKCWYDSGVSKNNKCPVCQSVFDDNHVSKGGP